MLDSNAEPREAPEALRSEDDTPARTRRDGSIAIVRDTLLLMDFRPSEEQEILRRSVREFAEAEMRPHVMEWDEAQHFPMDLLPKLAALGLMGIQFPEQYGGSAMSPVDYCICIEELARVCPAIALSVAAHNGLCSSHIAMFGSETQRQQYLPRLVKGEVLGAWGLTEAGAGSDAAGMRTTAIKDGDGWVIDGSKNFITHGKIGGVMVVMAITDRMKGHRGISAFIVEHGTPGMRAGKKENKLGMRASDTSEVVFENCRVPASQLLGGEGQGFINTLQVLDAGRIGIAALSVGLAQGAYEAARRYALERRQFGQPIAAFQAIQWKLADAATRIEAARLLTYRAAYLGGQDQRTTRESSEAKLYASEIAVRVAEDCVQIHGGYGFVKDYPAEKYFRDVKLLTIGEGTSEIQRLVIARQLLGS
jgi:alkylation response protein AidB-like acyl-CoA dehydrogenase